MKHLLVVARAVVACCLVIAPLVMLPSPLPAQGAAAPSSRVAPAAQAPTPVRDSAARAITAFFHTWESAWMDTELRLFPDQRDQRKDDIHCHPQEWEFERPLVAGRLLRSRRSMFSVCPVWRYRSSGAADERVALDAGLDAEAQDLVLPARDSLLDVLDALVQQHPADTFLVAQRVRFLVDQREYGAAYQAATTGCAAGTMWCALLEGYVLGRRGLVPDAERAYRRALAAMPPDEACVWQDLRVLIDGLPGRDCARRGAQADTIWWLADPLWAEPGNPRLVEQWTREATVRLRTMLPRDERWRWGNTLGNDVRPLMLRRYGWHTSAHWGGWELEEKHDSYLLQQEIPSRPNRPYTSYEYESGRHVLLPSAALLGDPFGAPPEDWPALRLPPMVDWPREHAALPDPLLRLPEGQAVLLRRADSLLLAAAVAVPADVVGPRDGGRLSGLLLTATGPDDVQLAGASEAVVDGVLRLAAAVGPGGQSATPLLFSVEVLPERASASPGARWREGLLPEGLAAAPTPGVVSVSAPLLVELGPGQEVPAKAEAALARLAPSRRLRGQTGIYWESYGLAASDSAEVAVWLRPVPAGLLRRAGSLLGLRPDASTPVVVSWLERPGGAGRAVVEQGAVPVLGRGVVLDLAGVPAGAYWLEVSVGSARSRVRVVVEP